MSRVVSTSNIEGVMVPKNPYAWSTSVTGVQKLVVTTAQNGVDWRLGSDGRIAEGFVAQVRQAFANLRTVLASEDMGVDDIMALHHCIVGHQDLTALNVERLKFLGEARPASSLMIVSGLWNPDAVYEVAAIAAR
jgi:2-iminobutanoate/2-iminopropanoate deaminase